MIPVARDAGCNSDIVCDSRGILSQRRVFRKLRVMYTVQRTHPCALEIALTVSVHCGESKLHEVSEFRTAKSTSLNLKSAQLFSLLGNKSATLEIAHEAAIHDLFNIYLRNFWVHAGDNALHRLVGCRIRRDIESRH